MPTPASRRIDLIRGWSFTPSRATDYFRRQRIKDFLFGLRRAPRTAVLRAADRRPVWILYFVYLPDGALTAAHRFTLDRLARSNAKLLIVCATMEPGDVPAELHDRADALIWKALSGYDFAAYAAGLRHLARRSPGADVLLMNDSVLGPFADLDRFLTDARWDLTGFTGSANDENHVQSYAFIVRQVTRRRLWALRSIFVPGFAFDDFGAVVRSQETRLARVAARRMSVGAYWFDADPLDRDPTLFAAIALLDEGFPFVKKSALGKFRHVLDPGIATLLDRRLADAGHCRFP